MSSVSVFHDTSLRMALDYAGVAVFAATGALAAARRGYDIITFAFFAAITGIGGGTLRDLLLGAPVFWVSDAGYIGVCIIMAAVVWAFGGLVERFRPLLWLDALGLAAYCVVGASKAADWGAPPLVAAGMGVLTATFGGIVRDVLAGQPSVLLRKEIYVTAAIGGAGLYVVARWKGAPDGIAATLGVLMGFGLRAGALAWGWKLPGYGQIALTAPLRSPVPVTPKGAPPVPASPVAAAPPSPPVVTVAEPAMVSTPTPARPTAAAKRAALAETVEAAKPPTSPGPKPRKAKAVKLAAASIEPAPPTRSRRPRAPKGA